MSATRVLMVLAMLGHHGDREMNPGADVCAKYGIHATHCIK